jgi:hypothetical protein
MEREVDSLLSRKYEGLLSSIEVVPKEDLELVSFFGVVFG